MDINGHELHIESYGPESGPPVILLHHGLGSVRSWKKQIPALVAQGYRVTAYDRWGYGQSACRPSLGMPAFEADVADLLAIVEASQEERVALVGHSDGGTIALYFASRYPQHVAALVAIAAHIYIEPRMKSGLEAVGRRFEEEGPFRQALQRIHGEKYATLFSSWYNGWHSCECSSWDMRPLLGEISCPALVVQGEADEHASSQQAYDLQAALRGAGLWIVPAAGHLLPQDQAEAFNPRLVKFLQTAVLPPSHWPPSA